MIALSFWHLKLLIVSLGLCRPLRSTALSPTTCSLYRTGRRKHPPLVEGVTAQACPSSLLCQQYVVTRTRLLQVQPGLRLATRAYCCLILSCHQRQAMDNLSLQHANNLYTIRDDSNTRGALGFDVVLATHN